MDDKQATVGMAISALAPISDPQNKFINVDLDASTPADVHVAGAPLPSLPELICARTAMNAAIDKVTCHRKL
jgi:hypothetical protein